MCVHKYINIYIISHTPQRDFSCISSSCAFFSNCFTIECDKLCIFKYIYRISKKYIFSKNMYLHLTFTNKRSSPAICFSWICLLLQDVNIH